MSQCKFVGNIIGNVAQPAFCEVEGDNANRRTVMALQQIADHCHTICSALLGFSPSSAQAAAQIVEHQIDIPI
jgi:hypothetical protein